MKRRTFADIQFGTNTESPLRQVLRHMGATIANSLGAMVVFALVMTAFAGLYCATPW